MIHKNVKTIADLVNVAGKEHNERVFLRYEDNDVIKEVTYAKFADTCKSVAQWVEQQSEALGRKARVGFIAIPFTDYV